MVDSADLKQAGLKTTLPRLRVLSILENSKIRHLSAEDVYKELLNEEDSVGLATVYRVLTQFEDAGLVIRHHFEGDRSVFELNDEDHHDHMICDQCGKVTEFVDRRIESLQEKVAEDHGFSLQDHSLTLYGICARCQNSRLPK
ncbi:ferric iron uptake transcriptional regulator [Candidatus Spongiihabitans sp.]|uniref:ferric iron uptake transcriptional regulator n=1 Tax=Candidatus Spongiihabitans sp. TaxID=3101308 RepID=UPI003C6EE68C